MEVFENEEKKKYRTLTTYGRSERQNYICVSGVYMGHILGPE